MGDLVVGCPVAHREWIIDVWFDHVREACDRASMTPEFVFVGAPPADWPTFSAIEAQKQKGGERVIVVNSGEVRPQRQRSWSPQRYETMANLRNQLLACVRAMDPRFFLSVDSDILLHPDVLTNLIETAGRFDAVGGRCYMTPSGVQWPSYGIMKTNGGIRRAGDFQGVFKVDCIMALKLMGPRAYNIDYRPHQYGEDVGWSHACKEAGVKFGWDGRVVSKHVLDPRMLSVADPRVGW